MMKLLRITGSGWLTITLLASLAASYVIAGIWGDPFALWRGFLMETIPGLLIYTLFILNLITAALVTYFKSAGKVEFPADEVKAMDASLIVRAEGFDAGNWLEDKGFKPVEVKDGFIVRQGRYSYIPGMLLRLSLVIVLASLAYGVKADKRAEVILAPGDKVQVLGRTLVLNEIDANLPEDYLHVGNQSTLKLEGVRTEISIDGKNAVLTDASPSTLGGITLRLAHIGYRMPIRTEGLKVTADLDALPPGKSSQPAPGISMSLLPEKKVKQGLLSGYLYNLREPYFNIALSDTQSYRLRPEETSPDGAVSFGRLTLFAQIEARRDPSIWLLKLGITLLLISIALMLLRLTWYERVIAIAYDKDEVVIGQTHEIFKGWGIAEFREMTASLQAEDPSSDE
jgi:hypothetical protein